MKNEKVTAFILTVIMMISMSMTVFASVETDHDDYNDYSWEKEDIEGTPSQNDGHILPEQVRA